MSISHRIAWKQWPVIDHLYKDAANGPDIHRGGVGLSTQQDFWGPVPQCHNLKFSRCNNAIAVNGHKVTTPYQSRVVLTELASSMAATT